jgi:hypothetical protein
MSIDEIYSKYYNVSAVSALNDISSVQNVKTDDEGSSETVGSVSAAKTDTYVSTITSQDTELRSENYNDIINQVRQAKAAMASKEASSDEEEDYSAILGGTTGTSESEAAGSASAGGLVGGAGGSDGGSSSDDEEETTTIVVINGQRYLETTTTNADGSTTVTRTPIGADDGSGITDFSAAAESVGM